MRENGNKNIKIKSNVKDDLCSVSQERNKLGNIIVDKQIKVLVSPKIFLFNIVKNMGIEVRESNKFEPLSIVEPRHVTRIQWQTL